MPKRPCAVILTPDDSTILCADKFGDVYSLPLTGRSYKIEEANEILNHDSATKEVKNEPQKFVPSATSLTVHTKRNLDALKQQQGLTQRKAEKQSLTFDHRLILGHVSLLTDIVCTSVFLSPYKSREYILTSDRDEHIRVSRGIPQAHIIEGYCLGHTEFISKLCLVPSKPQLLISGGGDDFLLLWDWLAGTIRQRVDLRGMVEGFRKLSSVEESVPNWHTDVPIVNSAERINKLSLAVSNIQILEVHQDQADGKQTEIIVTYEGIPALFLLAFNDHDKIDFRETYPTDGNIIDMVVLEDRSSVIYSMDNIHEPFSRAEEDDGSAPRPLVEAIHFLRDPQRWEEDLNLDDKLLPALDECAKIGPLVPQKNTAKGKSLKELLYGLESLRKRGMGAEGGVEAIAEQEITI